MITKELIDKALVEFARSIAPRFRGFHPVSHQPDATARPSCCFVNVQEKTKESGGEICYGWTMSHRTNPEKGDYLLANHHAVWRSPTGNLVDVTPFNDNPRYRPINWDNKVLFLAHEDSLPVTQGQITAPLPDRFFAIGEEDKILEYVRELSKKEERECAEIYQGNFDSRKIMQITWGLTMELNEKTSHALDGWIGPDTWYKNHDSDMQRFYRFIDQYEKEHGTRLDEESLIEEISERLRSEGRFTDSLQEIARKRVYLALNILEFLQSSGRCSARD